MSLETHKLIPSDAPISEVDLARRWSRSVRTLQRWRKARTGPVWMQIGGGIFYAMDDILAFEATTRRGGSE